jgi:putative transposase
MRWVTLTHAQRYHVSHATVGMGHLYQGRYKSFPVQDDRHYLTVLRYIEANPLRAELVADAGQWPWSSFAVRQGRESAVTLHDGPVELPSGWGGLVHRAMGRADQDRMGNSLRRGAPFGDARCVEATATRLNLRSTLRPRGRPKKGTGPL